MNVTVEISYYPLLNSYEDVVTEFIVQLSNYKHIEITSGVMSSLITGEYKDVMQALTESLEPFLEKYPSVFKLSIASACKNCEL